MRRADAERLRREVEEITEENDLIRLAIAAEGERSFFKWWDDDSQVPPYGRRRERIRLLKERLDIDHDPSVVKEDDDGKKSQQEAQD